MLLSDNTVLNSCITLQHRIENHKFHLLFHLPPVCSVSIFSLMKTNNSIGEQPQGNCLHPRQHGRWHRFDFRYIIILLDFFCLFLSIYLVSIVIYWDLDVGQQTFFVEKLEWQKRRTRSIFKYHQYHRIEDIENWVLWFVQDQKSCIMQKWDTPCDIFLLQPQRKCNLILL